MPLLQAKALRREYEACVKDGDPGLFIENIREALDNKQLKPDEFSVRDLFEEFVDGGRELIRMMDPNSIGNGFNILEAGDAVDTSAFSNIFGQVVYTSFMQPFDDPLLIGLTLCPIQSTKFDGERIPGMGQPGDAAETVAEGQEYPTVGFGEEWIETPRGPKRGFIVPITKEALFYDNTGQINKRANEVGKWLAVNREKRILDTVLGVTTSYRRNGQAALATYGNDSGNHDWDNLAGIALADWTDIEEAELLFDDITDPSTGEPILIQPTQIIVPTALRHTARRIFNATEVKVSGDTTGQHHADMGPNPLDPYTVISNQYVNNRSASTTAWWIGQFDKAFAYMQAWGPTLEQQGANSDMAFTRDIVVAYKGSEKGVPAVIEPRLVVKANA